MVRPDSGSDDSDWADGDWGGVRGGLRIVVLGDLRQEREMVYGSLNELTTPPNREDRMTDRAELIASLLQRSEDETLDFKATGYGFRADSSGDQTQAPGAPKRERKRGASKDERKRNFAKDLASLANTPRSESDDAHLVLGVKKEPDGATALWGLDGHDREVDDADLQSIARSLLNNCPRFLYEVVDYDGVLLGLVTIPPDLDTPCTPKQTIDKGFRENVIYYRRGSQNVEAVSEDEKARIWGHWLGGTTPSSNDENKFASPRPWDEYLARVGQLESAGVRHILIVDAGFGDAAQQLTGLGAGPWSAVLDFDPLSDELGVLASAKGNIQQRRVLKLRTKGDLPRDSDLSARSMTWYFVRGLRGREGSIPESSGLNQTAALRAWSRAYGRSLNDEFERWAAQLGPQDIYVTILWRDAALSDHLQTVLDRLDSVFNGGSEVARFVFVTGDSTSCDALAGSYSDPHDDATARPIEMPPEVFARAVEQHVAETAGDPEETTVPAAGGVALELERDLANRIAEDVEVVSIGIQSATTDPDVSAFLRGGTVTWLALDLQKDAQRTITKDIEEAVRADLGADDNGPRRTRRLNLYHRPGAGGTTVGRRIAWDFHRQVPTGLLRRFSPNSTVEHLALLNRQTKLPVLLIVDGADITERELDDLFDEARERRLPVVMLNVRRRLERQTRADRAFDLDSILDRDEVRRFADVLSIDVASQSRRDALAALVGRRDEWRSTPVYFALTAYEEEFRGLDAFVSARIAALDPQRHDALLVTAIADHYGQRGIPSRALRKIFGLKVREYSDLRRLFGDSTAELLVEEPGAKWRIGHSLIANQLIQQLLSPPEEGDPRAWANRLADAGVKFIRFCRGGAQEIVSDDMKALVAAVMVARDGHDLLGTAREARNNFSRFIDDVPGIRAQHRVLGELVGDDAFPGEHHFWLHLCRLRWMRLQDFELALDAAERAVELSEARDPLVMHQRGMVRRGQIYRMLDDFDGSIEPLELAELADIAERASADFRESRSLNPENEHGYISEVQMLLRLLGRASRGMQVADFVQRRGVPPYLRDALTVVHDLLEAVRRLREGRGPSEREVRQSGRLDELYGDFDQAIQQFNNLLARDDVYRPSVRRLIARAYHARAKYDWSQIGAKQLDRVVSLLRENMDQEGADERDLRMWVQAIRFTTNPPTVPTVLEQVEYWRGREDASIDATYYSYLLNAILAMQRDYIARDALSGLVDASRERAPRGRTRRLSYEWIGHGHGIEQLVHQSQLGDWRGGAAADGFWENAHLLRRVSGRVRQIQGGQAGEIELDGGVVAFFAPGIVRPKPLIRGEDENRRVEAYVGFTYDGPRAYEVTTVDN